MSKHVELQKRMTENMNRFRRHMAGLNDAFVLHRDALIRGERLEDDFPEFVIDEEERDAIHARQMGRTLADIDDLPES